MFRDILTPNAMQSTGAAVFPPILVLPTLLSKLERNHGFSESGIQNSRSHHHAEQKKMLQISYATTQHNLFGLQFVQSRIETGV